MTENNANTNTDKTYINSICNRCHWCNQCGEDNKVKCTYEDNIYKDYRFDFDEKYEEEQDDYADSYIERIIKVKRRSYNREWEDYMNYCEYKDWRDDYDRM